MHKLTVLRDGRRAELAFEAHALLADVLEAGGFFMQRPCGGRGACGKCAVKLAGAVSGPNEAERRAGARLSCQAVLLGDAEVRLPDSLRAEQVETSAELSLEALDPMPGDFGAAVDLGTTTVALKLYDLQSGACVGEAALLNPQAAVAADVMGRIGAALGGRLGHLRSLAVDAVRALLDEACGQAGILTDAIESLVVAGNTTMLYLLTGRDPACLSRAPFRADCLFGMWAEVLGRRAYLPPCMGAFVGADTTCAALSSGMCDKSAVSALCDIGTNGEIALWDGGALFVTSTAAGPAFEGAGVSSGCGSVRGAIDRVRIENGKLRAHTIGGARAVGVCGSGLIDAVAALLKLGEIDETGAARGESFPLRDGVELLPKDIRAVQLAKAAIAAGLMTLLETAGVEIDRVEALYVAGGFGSRLNVESAAKIGLIPGILAPRVKVIGNAALAGASRMLLNRAEIARAQKIAGAARPVNLGGNPRFNERYMEEMLFPET